MEIGNGSGHLWLMEMYTNIDYDEYIYFLLCVNYEKRKNM